MNTLGDPFFIAAENKADASQIFANALASAMNQSSWVNSNLKIRFCILFMQRLLEHRLVQSGNIQLVKKIKQKSIVFLIRLLKRYPEEGLHILSQFIIDELQENQHFEFEHLVQFQTILLELLFPPELPQ